MMLSTRLLMCSAPPPFSGVLDTLGTWPLAAYSLRRLIGKYFGPAIQVIRSSDNAAMNIGFTPAGDLDINGLLNFVGPNDGRVAVFYDQSGNGLHMTNSATSRYPYIVTAGTLNTAGAGLSLPGILSTATVSTMQSLLATQGMLNISQPFTRNSVTCFPPGIRAAAFAILGSTSNVSVLPLNAANLHYQMYDYTSGLTSSNAVLLGVPNSVFEVYNTASSSIVVNGITTTGALGTDSPGYIEFGALTQSANVEAIHSEILQFTGILPSADLNMLYADQKAYWGTP